MKVRTAEDRCSASVHDGGRFMSYHNCYIKATVTRKGFRYCPIHDPVVVAKKKEAQDAKWKLETKVKEAGWAIGRLNNKLLRQLESDTCGVARAAALIDTWRLKRKALNERRNKLVILFKNSA